MASYANNGKQRAIIRRRTLPSRRSRSGLIRFARDNTSQNGEDGIIDRIFALMRESSSSSRTDEQPPLWCVDVGAWDGVHLSNTHTLLTKSSNKWKGVLIEADPERFQDLKALHEPLKNITINATVSCQTGSPHHLVSLLKSVGELPREIGFLCIDVDGTDYWLLRDLLESNFYNPRLVCVEFNPTIPNDLIYIPPRSDTERHGCSLAALVELMEAHSYTLVETTLYNSFFVPTRLYEEFLYEEVRDTSIDVLHEVTMGTELYQLYDGTIKLHGCKKLLWHRLPMDERKLQVLPQSKRRFPFAPTSSAASSTCPNAVDMSAYCCLDNMGGDDVAIRTKKQQVCRDALWEQLDNDGFAFVKGTGLSVEMCQNALHWTRAFLHEADESVRRSTLSSRDRARRGYSPMCTENFASLLGVEGVPNDLVRKFRVGPETTIKGRSESTSPLLSPNLWPRDWEPAFQKTVEDYFERCNKAAQAIVRAICDAVVHKRPQLAASLRVFGADGGMHSQQQPQSHTSILTLLGYRVGTRHKRKPQTPLVAAHTDVGVVTMLLFDSGGCAVLQRAATTTSGNGEGWVDVNLQQLLNSTNEPTFVINIGDCLSELSGLPSTTHRVIPTSLATPDPRSCLALFVGLDPSQELTLPATDETITYEEWRKRRIAKAQQIQNLGQKKPGGKGGVAQR